ncbi:hypothetical protein ACGGZK_19115 [Agromyces sp. MMS24-K17]|uniref:hypothetical protein n=1 Tax=Agromyces sp. MMS24-K17 TaxID=3372850 RepID=UPI0037546F31
MHIVGRLTPEEFWAQVDAGDDEVRRTFGERAVFGVRNWPGRAMVGEWAFGEGVRAILFVPYAWDGVDYSDPDLAPRVDVLVDTVAPRELVARRMELDAFLAGDTAPRRLLEAPAPDAIVDVLVDGVAEPFELWAREGVDRSRVAGRLAGATVVIESTGHPLESLELERIRDVEGLLAERRRWLRALRGGE